MIIELIILRLDLNIFLTILHYKFSCFIFDVKKLYETESFGVWKSFNSFLKVHLNNFL